MGHVCLPDFQIQLLNLSSALMLGGLKVRMTGILLVCFGSGFKIASLPSCHCLKMWNISWPCF